MSCVWPYPLQGVTTWCTSSPIGAGIGSVPQVSSEGPSLYAAGTTQPARARWVVPAVAGITAVGLAVGGLSSWAVWRLPSRPEATASTVARPGAAAFLASRDAAERAILARRGGAVQAHDEAEFLADLDPTDAALRTQQSLIYAGLAKVTFSVFGYHDAGIDEPVGDLTVKYGAQVHVAAVVATHQLAGYDTGPVVEAEAVTFVYRSGRWWFASDRDDDADLPAAGHAEPWDDGEVGVAKGRRSLVIGPGAAQSTLTKVAAAVDQAVDADRKFWPVGTGRTKWAGRVVVYLPRAEREFSSLFAGTKQTADGVVAVAIPVYNRVNFESGGRGYGDVSGSRIIVNPKYFKPTSSFFKVVLRHEVSHVAAEGITAAGTPSWLVEGLAEYVGWRQTDPSRTFFVRGVDARTAKAINARTYHLRLPASDTFYAGTPAAISARYTTGFLVCAYIQHRYGEAKLKAFAVQMGAATLPSKEPSVLKLALHQTFGLTASQLQDDVSSWLREFTVDR
jgi:hypothetical protein